MYGPKRARRSAALLTPMQQRTTQQQHSTAQHNTAAHAYVRAVSGRHRGQTTPPRARHPSQPSAGRGGEPSGSGMKRSIHRFSTQGPLYPPWLCIGSPRKWRVTSSTARKCAAASACTEPSQGWRKVSLTAAARNPVLCRRTGTPRQTDTCVGGRTGYWSRRRSVSSLRQCMASATPLLSWFATAGAAATEATPERGERARPAFVAELALLLARSAARRPGRRLELASNRRPTVAGWLSAPTRGVRAPQPSVSCGGHCCGHWRRSSRKAIASRGNIAGPHLALGWHAVTQLQSADDRASRVCTRLAA